MMAGASSVMASHMRGGVTELSSVHVDGVRMEHSSRTPCLSPTSSLHVEENTVYLSLTMGKASPMLPISHAHRAHGAVRYPADLYGSWQGGLSFPKQGVRRECVNGH